MRFRKKNHFFVFIYNIVPKITNLTKHLSFLFLVLVVVTTPKNGYSQKKNDDPFARSGRLPDFSVGLLFNANTMVKYKVPGGSLAFNSTYYDFDRRFLVGVEVAKNICNTRLLC